MNRSIRPSLTALALFASFFAASTASAETITLDDFNVTFEGSSYDELNNQTTFYYSATGTGVGNDLSHVTFGFPFCSADVNVVTYDPLEAVTIGLDPTTGVYGIKWDLPLSVNGSASYSYTLLGDYGEGLVEMSVKAGRDPENGAITGPSCDIISTGDSYDVTGSIFLDADADGAWDAEEAPIPNTTVALVDADGNLVATTVTGADGSYVFTDVPGGDYSVFVPGVTDVDDINEVLAQWFYGTTASSLSVSVSGADVTGNDFGFNVDPTTVDDDFDSFDPDGDGYSFSGDGKTIGFWKHQHSVAIKGKGRAQVDSGTLQSYLDQVEALHIAVPFQFDDADEYSSALRTLDSTSSAMVDLLSKQLLATELNTVAGIGLAGQADLQNLLVAWAESLVANASAHSDAALEEAKDIMDAINNTGNN